MARSNSNTDSHMGAVVVGQVLAEGRRDRRRGRHGGRRRTAGRRSPRRRLWPRAVHYHPPDVSRSPTRTSGVSGPAVVSLAIIAINIAVFVSLQGAGGPERPRLHLRLQRRPLRDHQRSRPRRARDDHGRRAVGRGAAGAGPEPDLADAADEHVHARRLAAHRRQHALPVDLRRQRRAPHRPPRRSSSSTSLPA